MQSTIKRIVPSALRQSMKNTFSFRQWRARDYEAPSPGPVKQRVLLRNSVQGVWIETGTYLGDTAAFLSRHASRVVTIEPAPAIYPLAARRLAQFPNVEVINGASEDVFPKLLPQLTGPVNFWLDGHYSGGTTWVTYQGVVDTPIVAELAQIEQHRPRLGPVSVLIDDVRSFEAAEPESGYPRLDYLVDWARRNAMRWHIEHDIFVARSESPHTA